jgi:hypothetical protein
MADFFKNLKEQAEDWETNSERGNIWGWKFSLFGAVLIVGLFSLMVYRHITMGVPYNDIETDATEVFRDTINRHGKAGLKPMNESIDSVSSKPKTQPAGRLEGVQ